jgi:5-methylcytosine-specific restriction endonuclease McrA
MSRSVAEWIAKNDDEAIPARVKVRVFEAFGGNCVSCTLAIRGATRPAYDHVQAIINGGEHRERNLQLLCVPCHAVKTRKDIAEKAIVYRKRAKHLGLKKPRSIRSWRKFNGEIVFAGRER